jgi:hypothetical protein
MIEKYLLWKGLAFVCVLCALATNSFLEALTSSGVFFAGVFVVVDKKRGPP